MRRKLFFTFLFLLMLPVSYSLGVNGATQNDAAVNTIEKDTPVENPMAIYDELFNDTKLHEFIIEISQEEWDGITQDMIDYSNKFPNGLGGQKFRTGNYRKAKFIYKRPNGDKIVLNEIGIRTRGNESRSLPVIDDQYQKTHFKIKFDETFDLQKGSDEYEKRNDRRFAEMKALDFKWSRNFDDQPRQDTAHIREEFCYELLEEVGVTVPKASLGTLTFIIEGKNVRYGLYTIIEHVDKEFLKKKFGKANNDGNLYKCLYLGTPPLLTPESLKGDLVGVKDWETNYRPIYDLITNTKNPDHTSLIKFVEKLNTLQGEDFVNYMDKNFEVDKWIKYLAMGIYINNLDDYRFLINNYYLYFNNGGKIEFVPIDFDIALASGWDAELGWEGIINQDIFKTFNVTSLWGETDKRPLVDKILAVKKYKQKYLKYLVEFIKPCKKHFLYSEFEKRYNTVETHYQGKDANDTVHKDPLKLAGFEQDYFYQKTMNVLDQLKLSHHHFEVD